MRDEDVGFVPICDDQGKPLGAITDRDLAIRVLADGRGGDERVEPFMSRDVVGCTTEDDVRAALQLMRDRKVSRVVVCDAGGVLRGVISLQDVAEVESDEEAGRTLGEVKGDQPSVH
jgi:CBS domain-containing protein